MKLGRVCGIGECFEVVDSDTVEAHMDAHGALLVDQWVFRCWPDGEDIYLDPSESVPA